MKSLARKIDLPDQPEPVISARAKDFIFKSNGKPSRLGIFLGFIL
jgi:hypothetical protein